jgi:hypothetical protein
MLAVIIGGAVVAVELNKNNFGEVEVKDIKKTTIVAFASVKSPEESKPPEILENSSEEIQNLKPFKFDITYTLNFYEVRQLPDGTETKTIEYTVPVKVGEKPIYKEVPKTVTTYVTKTILPGLTITIPQTTTVYEKKLIGYEPIYEYKTVTKTITVPKIVDVKVPAGGASIHKEGEIGINKTLTFYGSGDDTITPDDVDIHQTITLPSGETTTVDVDITFLKYSAQLTIKSEDLGDKIKITATGTGSASGMFSSGFIGSLGSEGHISGTINGKEPDEISGSTAVWYFDK